MKNKPSRHKTALATFALALLLAVMPGANTNLRADDVTTAGPITTATTGTIDFQSPDTGVPTDFGIHISGGMANFDDGAAQSELLTPGPATDPGTGTLTLGGDVTITTADGGSPLSVGVYSTQNNIFSLGPNNITVSNANDGGMSAAFVYDAAGPFTGSITTSIMGSGDYTSTATGAGGMAFGMVFGDLATSTTSLLTVSDIDGTIGLSAGSTIRATSGDGGNAMGFLAGDINGDVKLGSVYATSDNGTARAGSAVAMEIGTVSGTLWIVGGLYATTGDSAAGQANDARALNLAGIAQGGSVQISNIYSTTGEGDAVMGFGINAGAIAGSLETSTLIVDNQSGGQAIGIFTDQDVTGSILMRGGGITSTGTDHEWSATAFRAADDTGVGKRVASLTVNGAIGVTATDGIAFGLHAGSFNNLTINSRITATGADGDAAVYTDGATGSSNLTIGFNGALIGTNGASADLGGTSDVIYFDATYGDGTGGAFTNNNTKFVGQGVETLDFYGTINPVDPGDHNTYTFAAGSTFGGTTLIRIGSNADVTMAADAFDASGVEAWIDGNYTSGGPETFINLWGTDATSVITMGGALTLQNTAGTTSSYAGSIAGNQDLVKTGTGTQLILGSAALGAVDVRGGVLDFGGTVTGTTLNVANGASAKFDGTKGSTFTGAGDLNTSGNLRVYGDAAKGTVGLEFGDEVNGLTDNQTVGRSQFTRWYYDEALMQVLAGGSASANMSDARVSSLMMHKWNTIWTASNDRVTQNLRYWEMRRPASGYRGQSYNKRNVLSGNSVWVNYVGRQNQLDSNYYRGDRYDITSDGIQVGLDIYSSRDTQLGVMFGYEKEKAAIRDDRVEADDFYFGLYGAQVIGWGCDVRGYFGYGHQSYDMTRWAQTMDGYSRHLSSFGGDTFEATFELGRRFYMDSFVSFRPVLGLDFYNNTVKGATESGDAATAVGYSRTALSQMFLRVGSDFQWNIRRLNVNAGAYYSIQMLGDGDVLGTDVISLGGGQVAGMYGTGLGNSVFTFTIGGQYYLDQRRRCAVFGNYYADVFADRGGTPVEHTGMVGLQYRF